jgi:2-oxoglutarate ferredoxin oxidoreductase subunit alpha
MQGDLLFLAYLGHGDTRHPCLYPADIREAYAFAVQAFDLAEALQTPVFVLSDLDLGMNLWMSDPLEYPDRPIDRGKVLDEDALARMEDWGRYKDVDGDGIPYRTLPGTGDGSGAYFTRGSGHDEYARYTEDGDVYARNLDRLVRKIDGAAERMPQPVVDDCGADAGILAFGTSHDAVEEARDRLRDEHGTETDYLRVRAFPFSRAVSEWIAAHDRVYVVEQNRDGQMRRMLTMELPELSGRLRSVLHYDGLPLDATTVAEQILAAEEGGESLPSHLARGSTEEDT